MGGKVIEISSQAEFRSHTGSSFAPPAIVDFTASWCGPCKAMAPIFEDLSHRYSQVTFLKVDVDSNQDIAREHGVRAMPTFMIFANGQKQEEMMGADPSALEFLLKKYQGYHATFSGTGRKLTDNVVTPEATAAPAAKPAEVDLSKPTTSIQIRTSDGRRLLAKFNTDSTVGDLRSHIRNANPGGPTAFVLMVGVPPKPLTADDAETLQQAGLENAVVIVRG